MSSSGRAVRSDTTMATTAQAMKPGTISYISADRLVDQSNGQPYYTTRVRITDDLPPEITPEQIYPGMPVETFIATSERTFVEYLVRPILDSFSRAFREE